MNLICEELEASSEHELDQIPGTDLVELSRRNVAMVEAAIRNDSAYLRSSDPTACPDGKRFEGSSAYWMLQLKDFLIYGMVRSRDNYSFEHVLRNAINAIDRDNSTHLNADRCGRDQMFDRLVILKSHLVEYLKHPGLNDFKLIEILSEWTKPKAGTGNNGGEFKARRNLSFASKFCQEACFYLFEGEKEQDNFSKYDYVVLNAIPKYLEHYNITGFGAGVRYFDGKDVEAYRRYHAAIHAILSKLTNPISRNGFDHLLWYYFKGRQSILKGKIDHK